MAKFTKADLRTGDIVIDGRGWVGVVLLPETTEPVIMWSFGKEEMALGPLSNYLDNLAYRSPRYADNSIQKVYRPRNMNNIDKRQKWYKGGKLVYNRDRDETEEMTLEEVCKALGKNIKIVKE